MLVRLLRAVLRYPAEPADPYGSAGSVRVLSASPRYLAYRMVTLWARLLGVFAIEELLLHRAIRGDALFIAKAGLFLAIVGIPGLIISLFTYAEYKARSYKLSDQALRIREGLFTVRETTMTYANVQNVSVSRGPVQGLFGISDVVMKTAGGGGGDPRTKGFVPDLHVAHFRGLRNADEVRELVLALLKKTKDAGLGDGDDAAPASAAAPVKSLDAALAEVRAAATGLREAAERLV
jgi:membrane protein YdbS with pleckstrin-like domain